MDTIMTLCTCIETEKTILLSRRSPLKGELLSFVRGLTKGNLSLKLSTVALSDAGRYRCSIHTDKLQKSCYVNLTVGESNVIGSHDPVNATVGDDAILPCHLKPPFDVRTLTVEWTRDGQSVHIWRHEKEYLNDQDKNFRGRTSLFHEEMIRGNISLKLTNVTELDAGSYSCNVPKLESQVRKGFINLTVEPVGQKNDKGSQTNKNSGGTGFSTGDIIGIALGVITVIAIVVVLAVLKKLGKIRQEREYPPAQRDNDAVTIPMLNINTTTDCSRPNTTGHNGQNREGSQEDNAEDNNEDSAEDNAEDNNEDSAEENAEDNNEDSAEH
ncbi:uncharacterized protein LOC127360621 isoform X3 [Dicentrarchus labrax]|uniref:uncharacterized protein LOC127360621 isoform X3 n=1 Tax=Dicentrarchus labrax TaxID=13489 RepID=UPI0021F633E2|nr:uncharacterized protein LOC127360621 isoform X3 [Dicentrarchus labrax]